MATSEIDICNLALLNVGQKVQISSFTDGTVASQLCGTLYPLMRDAVLGEYPWPFAAKHAMLNQLNPAPNTALTALRGGWANAYTLPTDYLAGRYIFSGVRPGGALFPVFPGFGFSPETPLVNPGATAWVPYEVELGDDGETLILLTDWASPEFVYTSRVTAVPAFHPLFVDCLGWKLSARLSLALTVKAGVGKQMNDEYKASLQNAAAALARSQREDPQPDSEIVAARM